MAGPSQAERQRQEVAGLRPAHPEPTRLRALRWRRSRRRRVYSAGFSRTKLTNQIPTARTMTSAQLPGVRAQRLPTWCDSPREADDGQDAREPTGYVTPTVRRTQMQHELDRIPDASARDERSESRRFPKDWRARQDSNLRPPAKKSRRSAAPRLPPLLNAAAFILT
jgi:hypothetical protein